MGLVNPLNDPLFLPTLYRALGILGVALVVLVMVERQRLFPLTENVLLRRWFSWSMILPLYLFGVLGGFTTFSAYAFESLGLMLDGEVMKAAMNIGLQVVLGVLAAAVGYIGARALLI